MVAAAVVTPILFSACALAVPFAYIGNRNGTVSVIDTVDNKFIASIPVGQYPYGVAVSHDRKHAYFADAGANVVAVLDTRINALVATIPVPTNPAGIAIDPTGKTLYVTHFNGDSVTVIDALARRVTGSIGVGSRPHGIAVSPDGKRIYVASAADGLLSIVDTKAQKTVTSVRLGGVPLGVAVSPDGTRVYVGDDSQSLNLLHVVDAASGVVIAAVSTGSGAHGIAVSPDGRRVYVAHLDGTLAIVDATSNTLITSIRTGSEALGVSLNQDGTRAYVANFADGTITIVDTTNNSEVARVFVGGNPAGYGSFIEPPYVATSIALEYYNSTLDHYFMTADRSEASLLDSSAVEGWTRTGMQFKVFDTDIAPIDTVSVCRFFSVAFAPKSSHFYTPSASECATVKANPAWQFEGEVFSVSAVSPGEGSCPLGSEAVYRVYNNGMGGAPNHRYTTDLVVRAQMQTEGWIPEGYGPLGVSMCVSK